MNIPALIFDIVFLFIAAIFITVGVKRGFIKSLVQSMKFVLSIVVTYFIGPVISGFFKDAFIYNPVYNWLNDAGTSLTEKFEKLPKFLRPEEGAIQEEVNTAADFVSGIISNIIGYVVTFALAFALIAILAWLLTKLTDKINFLGTANSILGGVFGALLGSVILFIIAVIVKFLDAGDVVYPDTHIVRFFGNLFS